MQNRPWTHPLLLGAAVGALFGVIDLAMTSRQPLADDSPAALLRFYGPMVLAWIVIAVRASRRTGRLRSAAAAGMAAAFATFGVFVILNLVRVNLFLADLTGRDDWQDMMLRFRLSGFDSLRLFVNLDYLRGTPFKIGFATALGGVIGVLGGIAGRLMRRKGAVAA